MSRKEKLRKLKKKDWWAWYNLYLNSRKWQKIRARIIQRRLFRCEQCGSRKQLEVHHLTYKRVGGNEKDDDLEVLCRSCHKIEHLRKKAFESGPIDRAAVVRWFAALPDE